VLCAHLPCETRGVSRREPSDLYLHPSQLVAEAVDAFGLHATVDTCLALLEGHVDYDLLPVPLTFLAGAHAAAQVSRGDLAVRHQDHWPRVWAARALRYAWLPYAEPTVVGALDDGDWRVREMAAKVCGLHELGSAGEGLARLLADDVVRVQVAAVRALGVVGDAEHGWRLVEMTPEDRALRIAVAGSLRSIRLRVDDPRLVAGG
jgi:HEAT repeat protein